MKLVRFVMLELGPNARAWEKFRMQRGPVTLGTLRNFGNNDGLRLFLAADLMLARYPERNSDLEVIVPEAERKRLEEALETAANLIAVATGERRRVTSPTPCVVFQPQDDDERAWLEESAGIAPTETQRAFLGGAYDLELTEDVIGALEDRLDGVALLAEALAHLLMPMEREPSTSFSACSRERSLAPPPRSFNRSRASCRKAR